MTVSLKHLKKKKKKLEKDIKKHQELFLSVIDSLAVPHLPEFTRIWVHELAPSSSYYLIIFKKEFSVLLYILRSGFCFFSTVFGPRLFGLEPSIIHFRLRAN